jgi:TM2 domain-containing membrane protein YozV
MMVNVSFVNGDSLFFMGIWNNSDHTTFLGKYDPRISSLTTILTPFTSYTYLKFSPDGVLYGASGTSLCAIDSTTGESTNSVTLNDGESAIICCGITFKPDGTMYIHEYSNRTGTWLHKLYSGHPATGTLTFIANITGVTGLYGIEYANGVLYGAYDNALYSINETTGARTLMVHFAAAWVSRSSWDFSGWG